MRNTVQPKKKINLLVLLCFSMILSNVKAQDKSAYNSNWPEWRGAFNTGAAKGGNTPVEFSETKNIKWKIEIPGKGHATPIIWGNQIIVQTAVATDKKEASADTTKKASPMAPKQTDLIHQFKVI